MRSMLLSLLLLCFFNLSSQCFFDSATGLLLNLDGTPCSTNGPSVVAPFTGFGASEFTQAINQIRVVAPEQDAIINSDQNPALLRQSMPYTSVQAALAPWQTGPAFVQRSIALKLSVQKQFLNKSSWSIRYENFNLFSLINPREPQFIDFSGNNQLFRLAYAQPLPRNWDIGIAVKYIRSSFDPNFSRFSGQDIRSAAIDIGIKHQQVFLKTDQQEFRWQWGLSVANFGPRIKTRLGEGISAPIPTSLNTGVLIEQISYLAGHSLLRIGAMYQINKLLTPSFCNPCDENINGFNDYLEYGLVEGIWASFSDSPQGARGEWQEINHQFDISAFYQFNNNFGIRQKFTLFYQHPSNGYVQYLMAELGLKWKHLQLDINYIHPSASKVRIMDSSFGGRVGWVW